VTLQNRINLEILKIDFLLDIITQRPVVINAISAVNNFEPRVIGRQHTDTRPSQANITVRASEAVSEQVNIDKCIRSRGTNNKTDTKHRLKEGHSLFLRTSGRAGRELKC
jgi:hypothetical protein